MLTCLTLQPSNQASDIKKTTMERASRIVKHNETSDHRCARSCLGRKFFKQRCVNANDESLLNCEVSAFVRHKHRATHTHTYACNAKTHQSQTWHLAASAVS
eukprot:m.279565 g.279565  ORF g.279565 m.279565 type:complete len:102 (+) comp15745_c0_seq3:1926-2231(+)